MKGLIRGAAGLAAVLAISACNPDETIDLMGPPTGIQATPVSAFILTGDSVAIVMRMVNDRNQAVPTQFTISNVGPAVTVAYDTKYRPDYTVGDTLSVPDIKPQQRYFAKGVAPGKATFTVTSGSLSTNVTVIVRPKTQGFTLNRTSGLVAGDTVTITALSGLKFTPTSAVTFATGALAVATRGADSTTIKVVVGPGTGGLATVTNIKEAYAPTLAAIGSLVSTNSLTATPAVTVAPTTVSTAAPAFGSTMTVTLGGGLRMTSTSAITVGGRTAYILSKSADSATATIVPFGGSTGNVAYTNLVLSFLNTVILPALPGDKTVTVGAVTNDPNALDKATAPTITLPAVGATLIFSDGSPYPASGACAGIGGGNGCRWYKFVLAAPLKVDFELKWDPLTTADLGLYSEDGGATFFVDAFGGQTGGTEAKTNIIIPAGTTYMVNTYYAPGVPPFFHLKMTGKP